MAKKENTEENEAEKIVAIKKKIVVSGLDHVLLGANGKPLNSIDEEPVLLTVKLMLQTALMTQEAKSGTEALQILDIAEKIRHAEGSVTLESSEYDALEKIISANKMKWGAIMLAQVYRAVKGL